MFCLKKFYHIFSLKKIKWHSLVYFDFLTRIIRFNKKHFYFKKVDLLIKKIQPRPSIFFLNKKKHKKKLPNLFACFILGVAVQLLARLRRLLQAQIHCWLQLLANNLLELGAQTSARQLPIRVRRAFALLLRRLIPLLGRRRRRLAGLRRSRARSRRPIASFLWLSRRGRRRVRRMALMMRARLSRRRRLPLPVIIRPTSTTPLVGVRVRVSAVRRRRRRVPRPALILTGVIMAVVVVAVSVVVVARAVVVGVAVVVAGLALS